MKNPSNATTQVDPPDTVGFHQRYQILLLTALTLLAAALRFYQLGEWSFWGDEYITVQKALSFFELGPSKMSLSLLLTRISLLLLGVQEWSARLPAAVIGVVTIPILYFPFRKIVGARAALLALLLLSISPWHIYWSQNARFYSLLLLFASLALALFYIGIEEDRPLFLLMSLVFLGLAVHERLTAVLLVPVMALYLLVLLAFPHQRPRGLRMRNMAIFILPGIIGTLAFARPFMQDPSNWFDKFGWINNNPFWLFSGFVYYVGIPAIVLAAVGGVSLIRRGRRDALLFGLAAVIPLGAVLILSMLQYTANRYIFLTLSSWLLLAALATLEFLDQSPRSQKLFGLGVLGILLLTSASEDVLYFMFQQGNRDNWKAAYQYIRLAKRPDDLVVSSDPFLGAYYLGEFPHGMESLTLQGLSDIDQRTWFLVDITVRPKHPEIYRWILNNARLMTEYDVQVRARNFMMKVYVYDPPGAASHQAGHEAGQ